MMKKSFFVCCVLMFNLTFGVAVRQSPSDTDEGSRPTDEQYSGALDMVSALAKKDGHLSPSRQLQLDKARAVITAYDEKINVGLGSPQSPAKKKKKK